MQSASAAVSVVTARSGSTRSSVALTGNVTGAEVVRVLFPYQAATSDEVALVRPIHPTASTDQGPFS